MQSLTSTEVTTLQEVQSRYAKLEGGMHSDVEHTGVRDERRIMGVRPNAAPGTTLQYYHDFISCVVPNPLIYRLVSVSFLSILL